MTQNTYSKNTWKNWTQSLIKLTISQKLRVTQKKTIDVKNHYQINQDLSCKFSHFWRKLNFLRIFLDLLDAYNSKTQYYAIWFFQHIAHLLCQDGHFWGGEGFCISLLGKGQVFHLFALRLTHLTPGIGPSGQIDMCEHNKYDFCVRNPIDTLPHWYTYQTLMPIHLLRDIFIL